MKGKVANPCSSGENYILLDSANEVSVVCYAFKYEEKISYMQF